VFEDFNQNLPNDEFAKKLDAFAVRTVFSVGNSSPDLNIHLRFAQSNEYRKQRDCKRSLESVTAKVAKFDREFAHLSSFVVRRDSKRKRIGGIVLVHLESTYWRLVFCHRIAIQSPFAFAFIIEINQSSFRASSSSSSSSSVVIDSGLDVALMLRNANASAAAATKRAIQSVGTPYHGW
jgi:hypothetical protein